jgi:hypothetical protein
MAGVTNGTAAVINAQFPQAFYLYCAFAVVKSLQVTSVKNMMGYLGCSPKMPKSTGRSYLNLPAIIKNPQVERYVPH